MLQRASPASACGCTPTLGGSGKFTVSVYEIDFDDKPLKELDEFALLACQSYNLGNETDWFGCFRGGIYACQHRMYGIQRHYEDVHAWQTPGQVFGNAEYNLSGLLFCLDSAMECLIYGLNGLGFAFLPSGFHDVTDGKALRRVNPGNVIGPSKLPGYDSVYPQFKAHWTRHQELISEIAAQHDVSQHRSLIFSGGRMRDDSPAGYFEALGIADDPGARAMHSPMAEIFLRPDPKAPPVEHVPTPRAGQILVETLVPNFREFFNKSLTLANAEARANITLVESELRR